MSKHFNKMIAKVLITKILDQDLANSSWRETYPDAYIALLEYRPDMEKSITELLTKLEISDE